MTAPNVPLRYRIASRRSETGDTVTLALAPVDSACLRFRAGQFTMLTAFGFGEVPISISGDPTRNHHLIHTIRDVGPVTHALCAAKPGSLVGVRGPYGTDWSVSTARGHDLLFVAGGIGLAPLRPAILEALSERGRYERIVVVAGARTPRDRVFADDLRRWADRDDLELEETVDSARPEEWSGRVGFVTAALERTRIRPERTTAFVCGPEPMMEATCRVLEARGVDDAEIRLSYERNMRCGIGWCGHCQLGPLLLCRDGPVLDRRRTRDLLAVREL